MAATVLRRCARCARLLPEGAQAPWLCDADATPRPAFPRISGPAANRVAALPPMPARDLPREVPQLQGDHHAPASTPARSRNARFQVAPRAAPAAPARPAPVARTAGPIATRPLAPLPGPMPAPAAGFAPAPAAAMPAALPAAAPPPMPAAAPDVAAAAGAAPALVPAAPAPTAAPTPAPAATAPPAAPPLVVDVTPAATAPKPPRPVVRPRTVEVVAVVDHGLRPEPGMQAQRFYWDVTEDPPAPAKEGEGAYVVYHSIDVDQDVRIAYQTAISVRAPRRRGALSEDGHRVLVDDRVSVQKRALLDRMDAVRARADQLARRSREKLARKLARRRARVVRWPRGLARLGFGVVRAQARFGNGIINAKRGLRRGLVEVPDHLVSAALRVQFNLSTPLGRKALVEGLRNPGGMNQDQRSAVLILTLLAVAVGVLLLNSMVALATPEYSGVYRTMLKDAALQVVGLFGAPIPVEPFYVLTVIEWGAWVAFAGLFTGKMLGAWVLILLGDSLHEHLNKKMSGARGQRMLAWLKTNANRYGFAILVLDNAIPFAPDQLMLVFAVAGMRTRSWMLGIAIGTIIKFSLLTLAVAYYGPDRILFFFEHPLDVVQGRFG